VEILFRFGNATNQRLRAVQRFRETLNGSEIEAPAISRGFFCSDAGTEEPDIGICDLKI
jgi:hypothetical protein